MPRQPSASPSPALSVVSGAAVFNDVPLAAFADPAALPAIKSALEAALALGGSPSTLAISTITDVASGVQIFAGGAPLPAAPAENQRRRLQSAGVKVDYSISSPPGPAAAAALAAVNASGTGAGAAAFSAALAAGVRAAAAASGSAVVAAGFAGATAAYAPPTFASASPSPSPQPAQAVSAEAFGAISTLAIIVAVVAFSALALLLAYAACGRSRRVEGGGGGGAGRVVVGVHDRRPSGNLVVRNPVDKGAAASGLRRPSQPQPPLMASTYAATAAAAGISQAATTPRRASTAQDFALTGSESRVALQPKQVAGGTNLTWL